MSGESVLIVEDNQINLMLIKLLLLQKGYILNTAGRAEEALEILDKLQPDLILMDIQLPGMDGLELTTILKANPRFDHVPIIAVTAYAMQGDKEKALKAGCSGYITKPIDVKTFPEMIGKYLESIN